MPLVLQAKNIRYNELPDSTRSKIRLSSYLLIQPEDFDMQEILQLADKKIPLAFLADNSTGSNLKALLHDLSQKQNPIPVISENPNLEDGTEIPALVFIRPEQIDKILLKSLNRDSLVSETMFSCNELMYLIPGEKEHADLELFTRLWSQSGKLPNFIQTEKQFIDEFIPVVQSLNTTRKIFGVIRSGDQLLDNVSWKDYPNRKTNGYFSFPIQAKAPNTFSPYKSGYQFSPDIILDSPENLNYLKIFKAVELSADFGLSDHFKFDHKIVNLKRENEKEILNYGVELVNDETRGTVGWFPGRAYIDGGIQSRSVLKSNFSITAWVKPTKLDNNNSILGKGKNFVLKIHNGQLTYTMQGIKDYFAQNSKIPVNQWTFITLVHSSYENQVRFYLNGELTDQIDLITPYTESDYTLLIGSNLWEEFFIGYMDDIKIWARELNETEIRKQYNDSLNVTKKTAYTLLFRILVPIVLFLLFYLLFRMRKDKSPAKKKSAKPQRQINRLSSNQEEKVLCFGGLKVIDREGIDVSLKFSPKLKQLFIVVFLFSVEGQKGITTKKLSGILWPGMSPQHAKNTRGTNIQNLKAALASCLGIKLVFREKRWFLELDQTCYSDYVDAIINLNLLEKQTTDTKTLEKELPKLLNILKRGTLFPNMNESWLDPYISKMSDRIIELGVKFFQRLDEEKHAALIYELAEVVSLNDPLNEPALNKKLQLLTRQGKLSLARMVYDNFAKLYHEMYQEQYPIDFRNLT